MALNPVHADRAFETTTSTGTGTINLAGAETGYQTLVAAVGDGNKCFYVIEAVDGDGAPTGDWEHGYGTVTDATPDTLSRTTIISSSNAGSAVNFSAGTKNVYVSPGSRAFMEVGCKVYRSSAVTISNDTATSVDWNAETWDPFGMHDLVTNPSRITITVPGRYLVVAQGKWETSSTGRRVLDIRKNGTDEVRIAQMPLTVANSTFQQSIGLVECAANDYLDVSVRQTSGGDLDLGGTTAAEAYFAVQRISS